MATIASSSRTITYVTAPAGVVVHNINNPEEGAVLTREGGIRFGRFELDEALGPNGEEWLVIPETCWGRPKKEWWNGIGLCVSSLILDYPEITPRS